MFIEAILAGLILGRFRSGKIKNLEDINIKGMVYLVVILFLDLGLRYFLVNSSSSLADRGFIYYPFFSIAVYIIFIIFLEFNRKIKYFRLIEAGFILNLLPMMLNGGKMPVAEEALVKIGKLQEIDLMRNNLMLGHKLIDSNTRFTILSDIIPNKIFLAKVISIGDIIIAIGIALFIAYYMVRGRESAK